MQLFFRFKWSKLYNRTIFFRCCQSSLMTNLVIRWSNDFELQSKSYRTILNFRGRTDKMCHKNYADTIVCQIKNEKKFSIMSDIQRQSTDRFYIGIIDDTRCCQIISYKIFYECHRKSFSFLVFLALRKSQLIWW
jgi:hypothetical protein